ncbi:uncharacterized protein LOC115681295 [Syzygium oleosum]|uniref:uncharacterized protein LOC115681295 n=1 Tax=Syzygium oleosum TaxID=219896 RepID=UPI0024BACED0|nr:uncharacterized protein LOC115681295 [Syzygium oleosum]
MRFLWFRFNFRRRKLFRAAPTVYCEICIERVPSTSRFKTTARCKHSFCSRCLSSYVTLRIGDGIADVRCPGSNCRAGLNPLRCRELLSSETFLKWCDLLCESSVVGLTRCYCPNLNCRELIVDECGQSGDVKRFKCPSCRRRGCFRCASAWAKGHRCRSTHDKDLILLERLADMKKWVRCPNCRMYVERNEGCNLIHCRCVRCFCYACGKNQRQFSCRCFRRLF